MDTLRDRLRYTVHPASPAGRPPQPASQMVRPAQRLPQPAGPPELHHLLRRRLQAAGPALSAVRRHMRPLSRTANHAIRRSGRLINRHKRFTIGLAAVIGLGLFAISHFAGRPVVGASSVPDTTFQSNESGVLQKGTPQYATVLPAGRTADQLGGWTRVSPPNKNSVYAYTDQVNGIDISVSQQPVPADFKPDSAAQLAEVAKNFGATETFDANTTKVYLGTSAKGPQSLLLIKGGTLLLIKSSAPLSTANWAAYINNLR